MFAYNAAAEANGASAELKTTFDRLRDQEQAHANALRQALDSLGFDLPDAPDSPTDSGVFTTSTGSATTSRSSSPTRSPRSGT